MNFIFLVATVFGVADTSPSSTLLSGQGLVSPPSIRNRFRNPELYSLLSLQRIRSTISGNDQIWGDMFDERFMPADRDLLSRGGFPLHAWPPSHQELLSPFLLIPCVDLFPFYCRLQHWACSVISEVLILTTLTLENLYLLF